MTLEAGDWVWLSGPTGSGKSTLLSVLAGLPTSARVAGQVDWHEQAQPGVLLQNVEWHLLMDSVEDEIAFGMESLAFAPPRMSERMDKALALFGLEGLRERSSRCLSSGEKQRLALAALWAMERNCLLLDEPFAYLDGPATEQTLQLLRRLRDQGVALLVIEHADVHSRVEGVRRVALAAGPSPQLPVLQEFGTSEVLLEEGDLRLCQGQCALLLGANGAGKTTLLKRWAQGPGRRMVLQHPDRQLLLSQVQQEVPDSLWLERAGLAGLEKRHPLSLSLGQRRFLTVVQALAQQPRLLLLDEPSIGLDPTRQARLLDLLQDYVRAGGGLICASHDLPFASCCAQRVLRLEQGRVVASGGPEMVEEYARAFDLSL